MGKSKIEWLAAGDGESGKTWNPLRGCSRISPGCVNCYAETMAARFSGTGLPFKGYAKTTPSGPRWTGKVQLIREKLLEPLSWREPHRVFVCSMSDLFHEKVPFWLIDQVFETMIRCTKHTYLVLTKRAARMEEYFGSTGNRVDYLLKHPGIHIGISAEDQERFDQRYHHLVKIPAAVRFVSAEPLLGKIVLPEASRIHWIIAGGESGIDARPMDPEWCRELLVQSRQQGIAYFMKQMGSVWASTHKSKSKKGGNPVEWDADLKVREYPEPQPVELAP